MLQEMARYSTSEPASQEDRTEQTEVYFERSSELDVADSCLRGQESVSADAPGWCEGRRSKGAGGKSRGGLEEAGVCTGIGGKASERTSVICVCGVRCARGE